MGRIKRWMASAQKYILTHLKLDLIPYQLESKNMPNASTTKNKGPSIYQMSIHHFWLPWKPGPCLPFFDSHTNWTPFYLSWLSWKLNLCLPIYCIAKWQNLAFINLGNVDINPNLVEFCQGFWKGKKIFIESWVSMAST